MADVLPRREYALIGVRIEKARIGLAVDHVRQLPGQVVAVVDAGVHAAHPEYRHQVRRVAGE